MLDFVERGSKGLFLYKKFPEEKIEHTNNAAEAYVVSSSPNTRQRNSFKSHREGRLILTLSP